MFMDCKTFTITYFGNIRHTACMSMIFFRRLCDKSWITSWGFGLLFIILSDRERYRFRPGKLIERTVRLPECFYRWYSWAICIRHDAFHTLFINILLAYSEVSCNHSFVMQLNAGGSLFRFNLWLIKDDHSVGKMQLQSSSVVIFRGFCFCEINVQFSKGSLLSWG